MSFTIWKLARGGAACGAADYGGCVLSTVQIQARQKYPGEVSGTCIEIHSSRVNGEEIGLRLDVLTVERYSRCFCSTLQLFVN